MPCMLFGLTMSLNAPGAAPAGGLFEGADVDARGGEYPVGIVAQRRFALRDADQSVEESLQQVHIEDLVVDQSGEVSAARRGVSGSEISIANESLTK